MEKTDYNSIVEAIRDLERKGYTHEFVLDAENECVVCHQIGLSLSPDLFKIDAVYRFDGLSDPDDEAIVYAISSEKYSTKGIVVNAFGMYGEDKANTLIEKLNVHAQRQNEPIKRHSALVTFSREHHFGLLFCWKIRQGIKGGISPERIAAYVLFFFDNDLKNHFEAEEKRLFISFDEGDAVRKQAENEHKKIYGLIASVRAGNFEQDLFCSIADSLQRHIRFEERIFFDIYCKDYQPTICQNSSWNMIINRSIWIVCGTIIFGRAAKLCPQ